MDENFARLYQTEETLRQCFMLFAIVAVLMACFGLMSLAAFMTAQRTREIGIRRVFGASMTDMAQLISREFIILIALGNIIAWPMVYFAMQWWLQGFAYHADIRIATFLVVGVFAMGMALLTISYHVVKTAKANPIDALRYE